MFFYDPKDFDAVFPPNGLADDEITKDIVPKCFTCHVELCHELDAYYGQNPIWTSYCAKCRKKHGADQ